MAEFLLWTGLTLAAYLAGRAIYARARRNWLSPILIAPLIVAGVLVIFHIRYADYAAGAGWLVRLLGPAVVAFAVPIHAQAGLIRRHWPVLLSGALAGSLVSVVLALGLAALFGFDATLTATLVPRSVSTPFAMEAARAIGGDPNLAAVFVIATGMIGALAGSGMLALLKIRDALPAGVMFGVGAHAIGTARAYETGQEEGAIAGLSMVLAGVLNVMAMSLYALLTR